MLLFHLSLFCLSLSLSFMTLLSFTSSSSLHLSLLVFYFFSSSKKIIRCASKKNTRKTSKRFDKFAMSLSSILMVVKKSQQRRSRWWKCYKCCQKELGVGVSQWWKWWSSALGQGQGGRPVVTLRRGWDHNQLNIKV